MRAVRNYCKLCTFDVTNTLLKFKVSVGEQYAKVGRIYGVECAPEQITSSFLKHWKIMNIDYPNFGCDHGLTSYAWWKKIIQRTFSVHSKELSTKQIDAISNHLYDIYKKNVCWETVPGAVDLLQHLKEEHITLGVISNFDERLDSVLWANDLKPYFDFVLASYVVQVAKPKKAIFDLALSKTTGISSSNALHIGDNIKLDYEAAKDAGWNAILIHDKSKTEILPENINRDEVVRDIIELKTRMFSV